MTTSMAENHLGVGLSAEELPLTDLWALSVFVVSSATPGQVALGGVRKPVE